MIESGWQAIVTHGNGPQVGFILRRNELSAHEVHPTPLDLIEPSEKLFKSITAHQQINISTHQPITY